MTVLIAAGVIVAALFVVAALIDLRDRGKFHQGTRFRPALSRREMRQQLRPQRGVKQPRDAELRRRVERSNRPKFWN